MASKLKKGGGFWGNVKLAFAFGIGGWLSMLIFIAIGMSLFIGGFVLLNREQKKPKEEQSGLKKGTAFALMGIGALVAGGLGFSTLLGEVLEEL
nr:hypothetical protein TetV2_00400 [Oceanusvirus sp.]